MSSCHTARPFPYRKVKFAFFFKSKPKTLTPTNPLVVPRIKQATHFNQMLESTLGTKEQSRPIVEPIAGDMIATYAIDAGVMYKMVSPSSLKEYGLEQSALHPMAITNASPFIKQARITQIRKLYQLHAEENMAACSILFPALWREWEQKAGGKLVVAFPHRDLVIYTRKDCAEGVEDLKIALSEQDFAETHALSRLFYELNGDQWSVLGYQ